MVWFRLLNYEVLCIDVSWIGCFFMKVLLGHCFYRSSAPSGEDSVFNSEKRMLESHGVEVVALEKYNDNVNISTFKDSIVTALNTTWSNISYKQVEQLILKHRPDVAHFHNTFPQLSPSVYQACSDNGVAVVQTLHNYRLVCPGGMLLRDGESCELCLNDSLLPLDSLKYKCYRNSLLATSSLAFMIARNRANGVYAKCVNRYIALTDFARDRFIRGGLPVDKIVIKPNFLSHDGCISDVKEGYAVFVGRLSDEKGIQTLIEAWKSVNDLKLKVLGDGHLRQTLEDTCVKNNLDVEFMGFCSQEKVLEVVKKAIFQIIPSECYEGFPMSVLEAFSCKTPVIASRLGSLGEIISDGETGVLFESANSQDLLSKINALVVDENHRIYLAHNAREQFVEKYSEEVNFKLLMDIYNESINEVKSCC